MTVCIVPSLGQTTGLISPITELPDDEHLTAPQHIKTLRVIWNNMSKEERLEATKDAVGDVEEMRAMKENAVHNVVISAFHDVRANVRSMEHQVSSMFLMYSISDKIPARFRRCTTEPAPRPS